MTDISLDNPRLFYAAIALCVAPLWVVDYLPMVDLPQHLAQVAAMRELVAQNPSFEALFTVNWFTPYVLAYAVLYGLSAIVGIPLAAKLVLTLAIAATPLAVGALLREVGASARLRWLAIPGALGFAFYWGLFSFVCALPLALLLVLCAVRYANRPQISRAAGLGVFGIALFFSHVLALGIAALVGYAFVAGLHWRQPKRLVQLAIPFCVPVPLIAVWMLRTQGSEAHVQST